MKVGLPVSAALHAVVLGWGLVALSAPQPLAVTDVEAFPVEIVPIDEITRVQRGEREAPLAERSAPLPTQRPHEVPDAQHAGDNRSDLDAPPAPQPSERQVEAAAAPPPSTEPAPRPAEEPQQTVSLPQPEPVPAIERAPDPAPQREVRPDPVEQPAVSESVEAAEVPLPQTAPSPTARPRPPQAQTARAPEQRDTQRPSEREAQRPQSDERQFDADEVAALLNRDAPQGGGARRTAEPAALGGRRPTTGAKLTQSEEAALREQLGRCWSIPVGAEGVEGLRASVRFNLDAAGKLTGRPTVDTSSGNRQFDESAVRAVLKCDQAGLMVPQGKQEIWAEVLVNFDPSEMF